MEPPQKRAKLLSDDSGSEDESFMSADSEHQQSPSQPDTLRVNDEFAKRFEHNQQRAERHRLEEKYGNDIDSASESDSESQSEDDEGDLVTHELDAQINATLSAIRAKDPRVYDPKGVFYNPEDEVPETAQPPKPQTKPVLLRDYHRQNLLNDAAGTSRRDEEKPRTYTEEQLALKQDLLDQTKDSDPDERAGVESGDEGEEEFLVKKPNQEQQIQYTPKTASVQDLDVTAADQDPETYLSNFMASRAWIPTAGSRFQPFESDEEDDDDRADAFEQAYNLRFEDPAHANEKLISHSREAANKYSVRREEKKGRKRAREAEREKRDAEKEQRREEKARLRRLKIDEAQEKWLRLKEAAGLKKQHLSDEMLLKFLEQGFEGEDWDAQMAKFLGEGYDEEQEEDEEFSSGEPHGHRQKKNRLKKPTWNDEIDIDDIVPEFNEQEERQARAITLSDDENNDSQLDIEVNREIGTDIANQAQAKSNKHDRAARKREARLARQKIESVVDSHLAISLDDQLGSANSNPALFRYRETSPTSYGLSARDILMAEDSQLNQYAGLKKLATFRDEQRKARDKKKLGKKARLRQWRKDTFGQEDESTMSFEEFFNRGRGLEARADASNVIEASAIADGASHGKKKRKKRRDKKAKRGANDVASSTT